MVDREILSHRLALLGEYIADLEAEKDISLKEFQGNKKLRRYTERTLHLAVESCLDIASHIISDEKLREPADNKDFFAVLGEAGYLPEDLTAKLMKMAQFRNVIVHDYARLDPEILWNILQRNVMDLKRFCIIMKDHLG